MAPWLAAAGAFVVSLDSMMNIAFPSMASAFAIPAETIRWVIICYTAVYAIKGCPVYEDPLHLIPRHRRKHRQGTSGRPDTNPR